MVQEAGGSNPLSHPIFSDPEWPVTSVLPSFKAAPYKSRHPIRPLLYAPGAHDLDAPQGTAGRRLLCPDSGPADSRKPRGSGKSKWYDVEVVRQRAEVEEYPPTMDFLAWIYEGDQGLERDYKKAFMWCERAKLKGKVNLRGSSAKIFTRLNRRQKFLAEVQFAEDIVRIKLDAKIDLDGLLSFELAKLHVLEQQRDPKFFRKKRASGKK